MAIHEQLPRQTHRDLKEMGWAKAPELAEVAGGKTEVRLCNLVAQSEGAAERGV